MCRKLKKFVHIWRKKIKNRVEFQIYDDNLEFEKAYVVVVAIEAGHCTCAIYRASRAHLPTVLIFLEKKRNEIENFKLFQNSN